MGKLVQLGEGSNNMDSVENKRVQVNVDKYTANQAEKVISELGLTPTSVINALYHKIAATGKIPFNLELTQRQKDIIELDKIIEKIPVKQLKTEEEFKEFFDD